jgi:DNA-binding XRE family transcriptional regulator
LRFGCATFLKAMASVIDNLLEEPRSSRIAGAAEKIGKEAIGQIEESLPRALAGDLEQVWTYMSAYCSLTDNILDAVSEHRPDLLTVDEDKNVLIVEIKRSRNRSAKGEAMPWLKASLASEAMSAPFSEWVGSLGAGRGTAVALVELVRRALPETKPVNTPQKRQRPEWEIDSGDVVRFYRAVTEFLEQREHPLERVQRVLDLNRTELAKLFGVSRQAIERWERQAIPAERQERLASVAAICDLLSGNLKSERIPGAVRRPAPAYGGRSILEAVAAGDDDLVLGELRDAFDWTSGA